MDEIAIPKRDDRPEVGGYYLVREASSSAPSVVFWSNREATWRRNGRKTQVTHWIGPIRLQRQEKQA